MIVCVQRIEEVVAKIASAPVPCPRRWAVVRRWGGNWEAEVEGNADICRALCPRRVDEVDAHVPDEAEDLVRRRGAVDDTELVRRKGIQRCTQQLFESCRPLWG